MLTWGALARASGVKQSTVRFYERRGLLGIPEKDSSGYHAYGPEAARRIVFIRRAQELGFSLDEIRELRESEDFAAIKDIFFRFSLLQKDAHSMGQFAPPVTD